MKRVISPVVERKYRTAWRYYYGRKAYGELVTNGMYFCHLRAGDYSEVRRMAILKWKAIKREGLRVF